MSAGHPPVPDDVTDDLHVALVVAVDNHSREEGRRSGTTTDGANLSTVTVPRYCAPALIRRKAPAYGLDRDAEAESLPFRKVAVKHVAEERLSAEPGQQVGFWDRGSVRQPHGRGRAERRPGAVQWLRSRQRRAAHHSSFRWELRSGRYAPSSCSLERLFSSSVVSLWASRDLRLRRQNPRKMTTSGFHGCEVRTSGSGSVSSPNRPVKTGEGDSRELVIRSRPSRTVRARSRMR